MSAAHAPRLRWSPRLLCVIAGLLCTVGVLSGAALRAGGVVHHRGHSVAAVTVLTDGHGAPSRHDQSGVETAPPKASADSRFARPGGTRAASLAPTGVDAVRTRGPPGLA